MIEIINLLSIVLILFILSHYSYIYENFSITFGVPRDSSQDDKQSIKNLLEIGSQSDANKKYDVVSEEILGPIHRETPVDEVIEEEDPKCFANPYDFDYNGLKNYNIEDKDSTICTNNPSSCCDVPSKYEIDMDWNLLSETLEFDYALDLGEGSQLDLPDCCNYD